ncbi:THO complex subunit 7 [Gonapodya sp. JEL0774]|nr:THO complex subunit 7 [Gonapodya sp. JEL0774]
MTEEVTEIVPDDDDPPTIEESLTGPPMLPSRFNDDDNLIKNRRAINDKPLKSLARAMARFYQRLGEPDFRADELSVAQFLEEIDQIDSIAQKGRIIHKMSVHEIKGYERAASEVSTDIESARQEVTNLVAALEKARRERRNRLEYDAVAKQIIKLTSRAEMTELNSTTESQIAQLDRDLAALHDTWELRRKQFHTFLLFGHEVAESASEAKHGGAVAGASGSQGDQSHGGRDMTEEEEGEEMALDER